MPPTQADRPSRPNPAWRLARKGLIAVLVMGTLAWVLARYQQSVGQNIEPAGFTLGLQHGAVMPCTMPLLLLGNDVTIYAPHNTGRTYKLGYTLGVNACGLLFFGLLFARLNRWRKRLATRSAANNPCPERGFER